MSLVLVVNTDSTNGTFAFYTISVETGRTTLSFSAPISMATNKRTETRVAPVYDLLANTLWLATNFYPDNSILWSKVGLLEVEQHFKLSATMDTGIQVNCGQPFVTTNGNSKTVSAPLLNNGPHPNGCATNEGGYLFQPFTDNSNKSWNTMAMLSNLPVTTFHPIGADNSWDSLPSACTLNSRILNLKDECNASSCKYIYAIVVDDNTTNNTEQTSRTTIQRLSLFAIQTSDFTNLFINGAPNTSTIWSQYILTGLGIGCVPNIGIQAYAAIGMSINQPQPPSPILLPFTSSGKTVFNLYLFYMDGNSAIKYVAVSLGSDCSIAQSDGDLQPVVGSTAVAGTAGNVSLFGSHSAICYGGRIWLFYLNKSNQLAWLSQPIPNDGRVVNSAATDWESGSKTDTTFQSYVYPTLFTVASSFL